MKIRFASLLLALTLPLAAQDPVAAEVETMFYKAFYLEKGQNDPAGAMDLYQKFLDKAPEHKLAAVAAKQQFALLDRTGKSKERDAFKTRYEKLLGAAASAPASAPAGDAKAKPAAGGGGGDGPRADRGDRAARLAEIEKQLAKAKEEGNLEEQKRLEAQLERMKQAGGAGGRGGGRGGLMAVLAGNKKVSEMTPEEMTQLKEGIGQSDRMIERMREGGMDEMADKLEANVASLKKALDAGNNDDAQKALDALRAAMPRGGRGGRGGGEGGAGGGRGGGQSGGGGGSQAGGGSGGGQSGGGGGGGGGGD